MRKAIGIGNLAVLAAMLSACGGERRQPEEPTQTESAVAASSAPMPPAFAHCRSCHSVRPDENGIGPTLHGIYGQPAARQKFAYSPALKGSGLTWDAATLDKWLQGPMKLVPGTRMVMGVPDAEQRQAVIEYMKTLK